MNCTECFKKFKKDEKVYLNSRDNSDTGKYCYEDRPENSFPNSISEAAIAIGRRLGGGTYNPPVEEAIKQSPKVIEGSTVENKPEACVREHCVLEDDTCEHYEGRDNCGLEEDMKTEIIDKTEEQLPNEEIEDIEETKEISEPKQELIEIKSIEEKDVVVTTGSITFERFEEIKQNVIDTTAKYKNLVVENVDEEAFKAIKKDITKLNNNITVMETIRKAAKKKNATPYELFKLQVDEITDIVKDAKSNLEGYKTDYTTKVKEDKKNDITEQFGMLQEEYKDVDFLTLESIFDKKWLNDKPTVKKIVKTLEEIFIKLNDEIKLINLDVNGARIKGIYLKNGFKLADAKTQVLESIAREKQEQARIDATMEARNLKVEDEVIEQVKQEAKEEITNERVIGSVSKSSKVTIKFALTGDRDILKAIVAYLKESDVVVTQL